MTELLNSYSVLAEDSSWRRWSGFLTFQALEHLSAPIDMAILLKSLAACGRAVDPHELLRSQSRSSDE